MNTFENTVRDQLHRYADPVGEASSSELHAVLRTGRDRVRRRSMARRACAGVAALTLGATGTAAVLAGGPAAATEWRLATAPQDVNNSIMAILEDELPTDATMRAEAFGVLPEGGLTRGTDLGRPLDRQDWDQAVAWRVTADLGSGHTVAVVLMDAQSETEGDAGANCAADIDAGFLSACTTDTTEVQGTSVEVIDQTSTELRMTDDGLMETAQVAGGAIPASQRYFDHVVEAQPGSDFLVSVVERIKTPTLDEFADAAILSTADMNDIVLSPELLEASAE